METVTCPNCYIRFGLEPEHRTMLRNNHKSFYCPNGHSQYYTSESDADKAHKFEALALNRLNEITRLQAVIRKQEKKLKKPKK